MSKTAYKKTGNSQLHRKVQYPQVVSLPSLKSQAASSSSSTSSTSKLSLTSLQRGLDTITNASEKNSKGTTNQRPAWDNSPSTEASVNRPHNLRLMDEEYPILGKESSSSTSNQRSTEKLKVNDFGPNSGSVWTQRMQQRERTAFQSQDSLNSMENIRIYRNISRPQVYAGDVNNGGHGDQNRGRSEYENAKGPQDYGGSWGNANFNASSYNVSGIDRSNSNIGAYRTPKKGRYQYQKASNFDDGLTSSEIEEILNQPEILRIKADKKRIEKEKEERELQKRERELALEKLNKLNESLKSDKSSQTTEQERQFKELYDRLYNESQKDKELKAIKSGSTHRPGLSNNSSQHISDPTAEVYRNSRSRTKDKDELNEFEKKYLNSNNKLVIMNRPVTILTNEYSGLSVDGANDGGGDGVEMNMDNSDTAISSNVVVSVTADVDLTSKLASNIDELVLSENQAEVEKNVNSELLVVQNNSTISVQNGNICANCQCIIGARNNEADGVLSKANGSLKDKVAGDCIDFLSRPQNDEGVKRKPKASRGDRMERHRMQVGKDTNSVGQLVASETVAINGAGENDDFIENARQKELMDSSFKNRDFLHRKNEQTSMEKVDRQKKLQVGNEKDCATKTRLEKTGIKSTTAKSRNKQHGGQKAHYKPKERAMELESTKVARSDDEETVALPQNVEKSEDQSLKPRPNDDDKQQPIDHSSTPGIASEVEFDEDKKSVEGIQKQQSHSSDTPKRAINDKQHNPNRHKKSNRPEYNKNSQGKSSDSYAFKTSGYRYHDSGNVGAKKKRSIKYQVKDASVVNESKKNGECLQEQSEKSGGQLKIDATAKENSNFSSENLLQNTQNSDDGNQNENAASMRADHPKANNRHFVRSNRNNHYTYSKPAYKKLIGQ